MAERAVARRISAGQDTVALAGARQFLAFRVSGRRYALPAEDVAEVLGVPAVARLPHSPPSLLGLANIRGTVVPVVSPAVLLGRDDVAPESSSRAILLNGGTLVAWAV